LRRFAKQFILNPAVEANRQPEIRRETGPSAARTGKREPAVNIYGGSIFSAWIPAFEPVKKIWRLGNKSAVKAALDTAIHEKHRAFNRLVDGRVKPGQEEVTLFYSQSLSRECPLRFLFFAEFSAKPGRPPPGSSPRACFCELCLAASGVSSGRRDHRIDSHSVGHATHEQLAQAVSASKSWVNFSGSITIASCPDASSCQCQPCCAFTHCRTPSSAG
jgi:hypothetical protein